MDLKVVVHINQNERFQHGVDNINNLINGEEKVEICLVLTGEPVKLATSDSRIKHVLDKGVAVSVCRNAIAHFEVEKKDLIKGVVVVPGGALECIRKQNAGWAYLKP